MAPRRKRVVDRVAETLEDTFKRIEREGASAKRACHRLDQNAQRHVQNMCTICCRSSHQWQACAG
jgi:hypothetical protein